MTSKKSKYYLFSAAAFLLMSSCSNVMPNKLITNTATGAVAGAVLANKSDETRTDLYGSAVSAVRGNTKPKEDTPTGSETSQVTQQKAELEQILAGSGLTIAQTGSKIVVTLPEPIGFHQNSHLVKGSASGPISALVQNLNAHPKSIVQVIGNSDNQGTATQRQEMSEKRAKAVASRMEQNGLSKLRIQVVPMADRFPAAENSTAEGREANRRVDIIIIPTI